MGDCRPRPYCRVGSVSVMLARLPFPSSKHSAQDDRRSVSATDSVTYRYLISNIPPLFSNIPTRAPPSFPGRGRKIHGKKIHPHQLPSGLRQPHILRIMSLFECTVGADRVVSCVCTFVAKFVSTALQSLSTSLLCIFVMFDFRQVRLELERCMLSGGEVGN